jgi:hypothetical protein
MSRKIERDRPATDEEIVVTPEMVEAGLAACIGGHWDDFTTGLDEVLPDVFRAMLAASWASDGRRKAK